MDLIEIAVESYENVIQCHDADSGLNAIIAIHNTTHGPVLGGMRMWPYATPPDALLDATRLAQGMTYKSALAETGFGRGKAVILGQAQASSATALDTPATVSVGPLSASQRRRSSRTQASPTAALHAKHHDTPHAQRQARRHREAGLRLARRKRGTGDEAIPRLRRCAG